MSKKLIIISAGDFGREVFSWANHMVNNGATEWSLKGFLDIGPDILHNYGIDLPILGATEDYYPQPEDVFVCAVGKPENARELVNIILGRNGNFTNIIHPSVIFGNKVSLGDGIILCPNVVVSCNVKISNYVGININSTVGHDVVIGDFCQLNPGVSIGGRAVLKESVTVGTNSVILPKAVLEEGAIVGAGSVVLRRVPSHQIVFGVPAKPVALPKAPEIK